MSRSWAKRKPIKFEKPGWGEVNPGQNLFGSIRLSHESQLGRAGETSPICRLVSRDWAKRMPNTIWEIYIILGRGKVNPGQNWFWSVRPSDETRLGRAGKGNESYMYVGVQRLSETDTNKIWETRLRESELRSKFVWIYKAEWWESVWSSRPRERLSETSVNKIWDTRLR